MRQTVSESKSTPRSLPLSLVHLTRLSRCKQQRIALSGPRAISATHCASSRDSAGLRKFCKNRWPHSDALWNSLSLIEWRLLNGIDSHRKHYRTSGSKKYYIRVGQLRNQGSSSCLLESQRARAFRRDRTP